MRVPVSPGAKLPMAPRPGRPGRPGRDLAWGRRLVAFWGAPVALILGVSLVGGSAHWSANEIGIGLVVGAAWLGATCLANALRCNRTHCWVDGTLLPMLAVGGAYFLQIGAPFPLGNFDAIFVGIVVLGFVAECVVGAYLR